MGKAGPTGREPAAPERADPVAGSKAALRSLARGRRAARNPQNAAAAAVQRTQLVLDRLEALTGSSPGVVAAYWSMPGEPDTRHLVTRLSEIGHRVLLPIVTTGRDHPSWGWFTGGDHLNAGPMGLWEPAGDPAPGTALNEAEAVLCPGLLGGRDGSRLGTGGGWYDRALTALPGETPRWLMLFADEVVDTLPTQAHDLSVTDLVSESGWVHCTPSVRPPGPLC